MAKKAEEAYEARPQMMEYAINILSEKTRKNSHTIPQKKAEKYNQDLPLLAESKPMNSDLTTIKNSPQVYGTVRRSREKFVTVTVSNKEKAGKDPTKTL